jgi:hypothetical protein
MMLEEFFPEFQHLSGPPLIKTLNEERPINGRQGLWGFPALTQFLIDREFELVGFDFDMTLGWTNTFYTKVEHKAVELAFKELGEKSVYSIADAKKSIISIFMNPQLGFFLSMPGPQAL